MNVEDHRACGIGRVRNVHLAAGQLPHQPGIHRAEQDFSALGLLSCALHMVKQPLDFRSRKIRIRNQTGRAADVPGQTVLHQPVHNIRCAAALPDDSVVNRPSGIFIPQDGRFALVGDADARHIGRRNIGGRQHLEHSCILRGPNFHRILLDPSLVRIMLGQLMLPDGENILFAVK